MYNTIHHIYDKILTDKDYTSEVDFICKNIKSVKSILDVGCGTGTHAIELSKRGYQVTGIDPSKEMISEAIKKNSKVRFINGYLHKEFVGKFDCIISMFNVINHILSLNDLQEYFNSVSKNLNPEGILIFDSFNQLATILDEPKETENTKVEYDPFRGNLTLISPYGKLQHKIWSPATIIDCMSNSGMVVDKILRAHQNIDASKDDYKIVFKGIKYEK